MNLIMNDKKKSAFKEVREWFYFFGILAIIYLTGAHTLLQRLILSTGIIKPDMNIPAQKQQNAGYNFKLVDTEGNEVDFSDFKGKTVFMNIWATWCGPCVAEMPDIHSLYKDIAHQNIVFVMLSADENRQKVPKFIKQKGYTFPVYFLVSPLPEVFQHNSIPRTYVISPKGKIVAKRIGIAQYSNKKFKDFLLSLR
jgi:thiol-disulfide isomerase/thioredoxin